MGGTAFQAGRVVGDCGAVIGVEYTETVFAERGESGVVWCICDHSCDGEGVKTVEVEGIEEVEERGRKCRLKGERREGLGGEGG